MYRFAALIVAVLLTSVCAYAQGKGIDKQNERIREVSTDRAPATNGVNQSVGTGRGIDFGRGRTEEKPPLPNPYRFTARRDALLKAVEEVLSERKIVLDASASKADQGLVVSQPLTFTKGAVVSESELASYADVPSAGSGGWTRGRYTYIIELQPIDGVTTNVIVNAKIEGRTDSVTGAEWVTLQSTGRAEQDFLAALVERVTGSLPEK